MEQLDKNQKLKEISSELNKIIKEFNESYLKNDKGNDYTISNSFLELVKDFQELIESKDGDMNTQIQLLEKGLSVSANASESIDGLKKKSKQKK